LTPNGKLAQTADMEISSVNPPHRPDMIDKLLDEMIHFQQMKVLRQGRVSYPDLTSDDALNPNDFPRLLEDPVFNYEEGIAAGLLSAKMAIRAQILRSS
jgi:hypothetical protein